MNAHWIRKPAHRSRPRRGARLPASIVFLVGFVFGTNHWLLHAAAAPSDEFQLIVNTENPVGSITREFVADTFLKKVSRWPNGDVSHPVDLPATSGTRRAFSEQVLKRRVEAVKNYWCQRIFTGRDLPPPEVGSDDAVVQYVAHTRGGIGYVSSRAKLDQVKVLPLR
jgi:hypothetical protein